MLGNTADLATLVDSAEVVDMATLFGLMDTEPEKLWVNGNDSDRYYVHFVF